MIRRRHLLLSLALSLLPALHPAEAAREVSANRECATCHIMWLKEFNQKDAAPLIKYDPTPTVSSGRQDVASTERMCFSCHDGFVLDSRFMWKQGGHSHPVGVVPSAKVRIPTAKGKQVFPLNHDGKLYCGSCHSAHGVDWKDKESPIFLRAKNVDSSLCIACHLNRSTGPEHGNHPIFKSLPSYPDSLQAAGSRLSKNGQVICQTCHRPHAASNAKILVQDNQGSALCLGCHQEKRSLLTSKHNMGLSAQGLANGQDKTTAQGGPCSACHIPHNAEGPTLWARKVDASLEDRASATCLSCHADKELVKGKTVGTHSHPVGAEIRKLGIEAKQGQWSSQQHQLPSGSAPLPLFDQHGERSQQGQRVSCASCHDPHVWSQDHQNHDGIEVEGNAQSSFLRIPQDSDSRLCLTCHLDKRSIRKTPHNLNRRQAAVLQAANQGVVAVGQSPLPPPTSLCMHCHVPHNAKGGALRAHGDDPKQAPLESLCRDCHRAGGKAANKAIAPHSHPLGIHPARLKSGSGLPLFDKLGSRSEHEGLLDCATCHDPHRWSADPQRAVGAEGDGHSSFLRIPSAGASPLCVRCHQDKSTVLKTDHDLAVTAPASHNDLGQGVADSGSCAQCHALHNPRMDSRLWARDPGPGQDDVERRCRSCHREEGPAAAKVPPALQHPKRVTVWSEKARRIYQQHRLPQILVFDAEGKPASSGTLSCASCHEPHTWSADPAQQAGKGRNLEGDVMSSFLRNTDTRYIVCGDCHGEDAIYRYKYFHSEASRVSHPLYK